MAEENTPTIKGPDHHDFHDSSLIDFIVAPTLDRVKIVVSTPDENAVEHLWLIELDGVLRLEYESLGIRSIQNDEAPLEIYDVYYDYFSEERSRWIQRLLLLGESEKEAKRVFHIVLASSFIRGWGKRERLERINIICRQVQIKVASGQYKGRESDIPASRVNKPNNSDLQQLACVAAGAFGDFGAGEHAGEFFDAAGAVEF